VGRIEFDGTVRGPIDLVFDLAIDPLRMQECMPWLQAITDVHGDQTVPGDGFRFKDRALGRESSGWAEIVAADRPLHHESLTHYDNGMVARWTMTFTPLGDEVKVDNVVDYRVPAGIFGSIADRLYFHRYIEHRLHEAAARFEAQVDAEVARLVPA
jgi:uncharacterized membrane protein